MRNAVIGPETIIYTGNGYCSATGRVDNHLLLTFFGDFLMQSAQSVSSQVHFPTARAYAGSGCSGEISTNISETVCSSLSNC